MISDLDLEGLTQAPTRIALWTRVITQQQVRTIAEVGVYRGAFAEALLRGCPDIGTYYLIDPWRHLDDWNKPTNTDDDRFQKFFDEVMTRTAPWEAKRVVLRGRTTEVIDAIPDGSLDLAYVDGDHTLHGIAIDLIRTWQKVRPGGLLGGDDFSRSIWQHDESFEPTLVFPFAVYFAEAVGAPIVALPHNQFLIHKVASGFAFHDPIGDYGEPTVRAALAAHGPGWPRRHLPSWAGAKYRLARYRKTGLRRRR
jgi:hypothetical protein